MWHTDAAVYGCGAEPHLLKQPSPDLGDRLRFADVSHLRGGYAADERSAAHDRIPERLRDRLAACAHVAVMQMSS